VIDPQSVDRRFDSTSSETESDGALHCREIDREMLSAQHYLFLAAQIVPLTLCQLVSLVRELSDSPELHEIWKQEGDQANRIHQRLRGNFDKAAKLLPELKAQVPKSQALVLGERVATIAFEIICSITWVEDFGQSLADGLRRITSGAAIEVVDESDEEIEEAESDAGMAHAGQSMRLRLKNSCATLRAAMRILTKVDSEQGPQTVVDLLAAFSSRSVYLSADDLSEVLAIPSEIAATAIGIVLDVMQEARRGVTRIPSMTLDQLESLMECGAAATPGEGGLSPRGELSSRSVPLRLSSEGKGVVRFSLDLPDIVLTLSPEPIKNLFLTLGRKEAILRALGAELTWSSKSRDSRVQLSCDLRLPGSYGRLQPICDDSAVITARDMTILDDITSMHDGQMLSVKVKDSEDEQEITVMMLSSVLDFDDERVALDGILRSVSGFARRIGGSHISFVPNAGDESTEEGYSKEPFLILIQGDVQENLHPGEDASSEQDFRRAYRYLERWDPRRGFVDDFVESIDFSEPYVLLPSFVFEEESMLADIIALSTSHHLRSFDLSQFELDSDTFSGMLSRLRRELDVSLRTSPGSVKLKLSVECVTPEPHSVPEIRFFRTDEDYALYASGCVGVLHDVARTSTFPHEAMQALVRGVREALAELWPKRRLTAGDLQIALRDRGCQVSNSLAMSLAERQIRMDELMSLYEVSSIIIRLLVDDEDRHVLEMNHDSSEVLMLTPMESWYLLDRRRAAQDLPL